MDLDAWRFEDMSANSHYDIATMESWQGVQANALKTSNFPKCLRVLSYIQKKVFKCSARQVSNIIICLCKNVKSAQVVGRVIESQMTIKSGDGLDLILSHIERGNLQVLLQTSLVI